MKSEVEKISSLDELKQSLLQTLELKGYKPGTLEHYRYCMERIKRYMFDSKIDNYTPEVGQAFWEKKILPQNYTEHTKCFFKTMIRRLNEWYDKKEYTFTYPRKNLSVEVGFANDFAGYLKYCLASGNSETTIKMKERAGHAFCTNIAFLGCHSFCQLNAETVCKAILMEKNQEYWFGIKNLLLYLTVEGIANKDYSTFVPKIRRGIKLPSTYTNEEIQRLETAVNRSIAPGKRDYAMLLLASRLGIRAGDIANLRIKNLDFSNKKLCFIQQKTGVALELPMIPVIITALRDYLSNERPETELDYVFISALAPYGKISYSVVSFAVKKQMHRAEIHTEGRDRGPHSLRASLATSMVNDGVDYNSVRKTLGHESTNAIRHYAKLDMERLRDCALPTPLASGDFLCFLEGRERR